MKQNLRLKDKKQNALNTSSAKLSATEGEIASTFKQSSAPQKRPSITHDQAAAMKISDNESHQSSK